MTESILDRKARETAANMAAHAKALDPATILLLIEAIVLVVKLLKACNADIERVRKPGILSRFRLRRIVSRVAKDTDLTRDMAQALLLTGSRLEEAELSALYAAVDTRKDMT